MPSLRHVCTGLHEASIIVGLVFIFCSFLFHHGAKSTSQAASLRKNALRLGAIALIIASLVAEAILVSYSRDQMDNGLPHMTAAVSFAVVWIAVILRSSLLLIEVLGLCSIQALFELPLLVLETIDRQDTPLIVMQAVRLALLSTLIFDSCRRLFSKPDAQDAEETQPFLNAASTESAGAYGIASQSDSDSASDLDSEQDGPQDSKSGQLRRSGSWTVYIRNYKVFLPMLIPKNDLKVQACLGLCVLCLIGERFLNILVPQQIGKVTDELYLKQFPYKNLAIYLLLSLLHGASGLQLIQTLAKIPVQQFSYRQLTNAAFARVMDQAMDFHSDRDSAEVMKAVEQGEALTNILEMAVLEIAPVIVDMVVAFVYLYLKFNSAVAMSMVVAAFFFMALEVVTSNWNIEPRRRVTQAERHETRVMHSAVQAWPTVCLFNRFAYEKHRFGDAVNKKLCASKNWATRNAFIEALIQALTPVTFCVLAGLVAREVQLGRSTPGDFVFLIQYWDYIIWPISSLAEVYRYLLADLIDAERLLDLLMTEPTVVDDPFASALEHVEGRVDFEDVGLRYDNGRVAVEKVNIAVAPGDMVGIVGSTGAGKSSLMKLLLRLYDVTSGSIKIDSQDIRNVTQGSLRDVIGVVPQDPLLFNSSIMENLRYAKLTACDDEVYEACRCAAIHDKIMSFPQAYNTKVGEQGVKLSGGEVQRLAIARVFLKNPPIVILDEATSAIDTETEAIIQEALRRLSRKRTTFVIAHRLSSVVDANQIVVIDEGTVIERGTHEDLLERRGKYYSVWQRHLSGAHIG
ncbi:hypothetical protein CDD81_6388 [Ophiocordyceps australis]|uniref:ABC transporter domain-containing protein n=1 Tax=Ophiocordyceps australis TaxID=1399860 RepID=A0A2C5Y5R2_9HYPO|nr:hypothetical protein CDD81_6388 [Ophiocordyceps australis]